MGDHSKDEMGAAMFIPAMFAAGLYLIGAATAQMVMSLEHLAMIPAMARRHALPLPRVHGMT